VIDEWKAGGVVQDLRQLGFHPGSLAGREHDNVEIGHARD
jgi:hypothetical protein